MGIGEQQLEFEELNGQLRSIQSEQLESESESFIAASQAAALVVYGRAFELINDNPGLHRQYQALGSFLCTIEPGEIVEQHEQSLLRSYIESGWLNEDEVTLLPTVEPEVAFEYTPADFEAYETLYGSVIDQLVRVAEIDEPFEELDDMEVNVDDVVNYLVSKELDPAALAFVRESLNIDGVTLEALRKREFEVIALSQSEFEAFVDRLPELRAEVHRLLSDVGVAVVWQEATYRRKRQFRLMFGREAEALKGAEVDPRSGLKALYGPIADPELLSSHHRKTTQTQVNDQPDVSNETTQAILFADEMLSSILSSMGQNNGRLNKVLDDVTERSGISKLEVRKMINDFIAASDLYKFSGDGFRYLSRTEISTIASERSSGHAAKHDFELLPTDSRAVSTLLDSLMSLHIDQGDTIASIVRSCMAEGTDSKRTRHIVRFLERRKILRIDSSRRYRRGRKGAIVMFSDQGIKDRWKTERDDMLTELFTEQPN